jgi:hypothetical protein
MIGNRIATVLVVDATALAGGRAMRGLRTARMVIVDLTGAGPGATRRSARLLAAVLLLGVLALAPAGAARASWLYAGLFVPDHAPPGATVRATEIPFTPDRCPRLAVYLARATGISSAVDSRLIRLRGRVENVEGGNQGGTGTHLQPNLVFRVPSIPAGRDHGYWRCPTDADPNAELWGGGDFRVEAVAPPTSTQGVELTTPADPGRERAVLLAGALGLLGALRYMGHRRGQAVASVERDSAEPRDEDPPGPVT